MGLLPAKDRGGWRGSVVTCAGETARKDRCGRLGLFYRCTDPFDVADQAVGRRKS